MSTAAARGHRTDTRSPTPDRPVDGPGPGLRRGPIRRIVAGSVLTGATGAAVLALVVAGGSREHVVTGAALLGFAIGWGLLALLSIRLTDTPQRWSLVPMAVLATTGLGLLVVAPGDHGLTAAGWVWPPALLVLAVWTARRVRRSLPARSGRWALYPVVGVMVLAAAGGSAETLARASDQHTVAMPGQHYDVGGRRLHLDCIGSGSPTVVLLGGLGSMSSNWARVAPAVAGTARVCAYDRAGQGWSDDPPNAQDGREVAADLHALLDRAEESGPFVLAGHSTGGSYAMTYAAQYPEQVAGMVLLDPSDPYRAPAVAPADGGAPAVVALLPGLSRLGLGRLVPSAAWSGLPEPAASQIAAYSAGPRMWRNQRDEYAAMPALFAQARALGALGSTPLAVVTTTGSHHAPGFVEAHDRMAALSTNGDHRVADVTHVALLDEERGAVVSADAIDDVVRAVRGATPVAPG